MDKSRLKEIIREELKNVLIENTNQCGERWKLDGRKYLTIKNWNTDWKDHPY